MRKWEANKMAKILIVEDDEKLRSELETFYNLIWYDSRNSTVDSNSNSIFCIINKINCHDL